MFFFFFFFFAILSLIMYILFLLITISNQSDNTNWYQPTTTFIVHALDKTIYNFFFGYVPRLTAKAHRLNYSQHKCRTQILTHNVLWGMCTNPTSELLTNILIRDWNGNNKYTAI